MSLAHTLVGVALVIQAWVPATADLGRVRDELRLVAVTAGCEASEVRTAIAWTGGAEALVEVWCGPRN